jgi:copper chaperone CopZ
MKNRKAAFLIGFVLSFAFLVSACGNQHPSEGAINTVTSEGMNKASFQVTGMYCASCPFVVKSAIQRIGGIKTVELKSKGKTGTVEVEFNTSKTDINTIKQTVLDLGYGVR